MDNSFIKSVKFSLIIVYLVITAGAIVRMTGSGMGCPGPNVLDIGYPLPRELSLTGNPITYT